MNKVIMQLWEESERGWGIRPDGCSLHISTIERKDFIDKIYKSRENMDIVPDEYDRVSGDEMEVFIEDSLFELVKIKGTVRLLENELNNLINLEELTIKL